MSTTLPAFESPSMDIRQFYSTSYAAQHAFFKHPVEKLHLKQPLRDGHAKQVLPYVKKSFLMDPQDRPVTVAVPSAINKVCESGFCRYPPRLNTSHMESKERHHYQRPEIKTQYDRQRIIPSESVQEKDFGNKLFEKKLVETSQTTVSRTMTPVRQYLKTETAFSRSSPHAITSCISESKCLRTIKDVKHDWMVLHSKSLTGSSINNPPFEKQGEDRVFVPETTEQFKYTKVNPRVAQHGTFIRDTAFQRWNKYSPTMACSPQQKELEGLHPTIARIKFSEIKGVFARKPTERPFTVMNTKP